MMCEMIIGKTVDEAMKITNIDVEQALRDDDATAAIPPQKMHCSVMAYDVIRKAASEYKGVDMDSLEEEEIVCQCARVSLRTIRDVIRINDLNTVEEITRYTKAGGLLQVLHPPGRPRIAKALPGGHPPGRARGDGEGAGVRRPEDVRRAGPDPEAPGGGERCSTRRSDPTS